MKPSVAAKQPFSLIGPLCMESAFKGPALSSIALKGFSVHCALVWSVRPHVQHVRPL